jgi:predicted 2-oxoglutarate/Fe(II)-dependent dioxygenase YbiX
MINMSLENIMNNNSDVRRQLDMEMYECASKAINKYRELFPETATEIDTGYDLLRYNEGQFYTQHTDSFKDQQRAVSCSFHLNDDYEGGEFGFFDREIIIRAGKGGAILFPSNFMFPHEVMPVLSGTRYSIITWYV